MQKIFVSYERISTEEQSKHSILGQGVYNREFAKREGITIIKSFFDDGVSAEDFNRPEWKKCEEFIKKNKVDGIIVFKFDRLVRNARHALNFLHEIESKHNIIVISATQNIGISIHDPQYKKHRNMLLVEAEYELDVIRDRTLFGMWAGKSSGRYLGLAPYGYINSKDDNQMPTIVIREDRATIIRGIFDDFLNGYSFIETLRRAQKKGFTMKSHEAIKRILSKKVYCGLLDVKGYRSEPATTVKGLHAPIISEETFLRAHYKLQDILKPYSPKIMDVKLPLRGALNCEHCGNPHTGAKCKGRNKHYYYYWCNSCRGKNFASEKVHTDISTILAGLSLQPEVIEALKIEAQKKLNKSQEEQKLQLASELREYSSSKTKLESLEDKFIANQVSLETYNRLYPIYTEDINRKSIVLADLKKESNIDLLNKNIHYLTDLNWLYSKAAIEDKRLFIKSIFPGGLTTIPTGYRTTFIEPLFAPNAILLNGLLEIKSGKNADILTSFPPGVGVVHQIEPFLQLVDRIIKQAA